MGLVIGGSGDALEELEDLAGRLHLTNVHFAGRLDRAQVSWLMEHAELFVMPSRVEPFGIVVLEAWRAARPVVVSSRGGAPEFVEDGVTGLLIDPFDELATARALEKLLNDDGLRMMLGEGGAQKVQHFSWARVVKCYEQIYLATYSNP